MATVREQIRICRTLGHLKANKVTVGRRPMAVGGMPVIQNRGELVVGGQLRMAGWRSRPRFTVHDGATLVLGDECWVSEGVLIEAAQRITIGDRVGIGDGAVICDHGNHEIEEGSGVVVSPISIGSHAWIGRNVTVMPGVTIGEYAIAGAGAVVTADVPARSVVAGVPARVTRRLSIPDGWVRT